jgi:peptidylprolyl isomerase
MLKILGRLAAALTFVAFLAAPAGAQNLDPENTIVMQLRCGKVYIKLRPDLAPKHVARIKKLSREHFYDGVIFHRVISGFMAQTGDPTGTGMGGSKYPDIKAEFSNAHFTRGIVGMARSSSPDSANSQFFIMFADGAFLDGKYTVWGEVAKGMDCVDQIHKGEPPIYPDKIISMRVMKDMK